MGYLVVGCRVLLGTVFAVALVGKIWGNGAWRAFVASLGELVRVPPRLRPFVGVAIALGEAAVLGLLAVPVAVPAGLGLAAVLLAAFTVGIGAAVRRGVREPCRCFGSGSAPLSRAHVARNGLLTTVATAGAAAAIGWPGTGEPAGLLVAALVGVTVAAVLIRLDDIVALFTPSTRAS
jgi:hypothetical protein